MCVRERAHILLLAIDDVMDTSQERGEKRVREEVVLEDYNEGGCQQPCCFDQSQVHVSLGIVITFGVSGPPLL